MKRTTLWTRCVEWQFAWRASCLKLTSCWLNVIRFLLNNTLKNGRSLVTLFQTRSAAMLCYVCVCVCLCHYYVYECFVSVWRAQHTIFRFLLLLLMVAWKKSVPPQDRPESVNRFLVRKLTSNILDTIHNNNSKRNSKSSRSSRVAYISSIGNQNIIDMKYTNWPGNMLHYRVSDCCVMKMCYKQFFYVPFPLAINTLKLYGFWNFGQIVLILSCCCCLLEWQKMPNMRIDISDWNVWLDCVLISLFGHFAPLYTYHLPLD